MQRGKYVRTPETREKIRQARLGKKHTEEWKRQSSESKKGKPAKNKYTDYYDNWVSCYQNGMECREIAAQYGCTVATVSRIIKIRNIERHIKRQGVNYEEWAELYKSGRTLDDIALQFGCSGHAVGYGLRKLDNPRRDASHAHRVYDLNEAFFDVIDTIPKAYWLGFISADGNIASGADRLIIDISAKDSDRVSEFISDIRSDIVPDFHKGGCGKVCDMVRVNVNNQHLINSLKSHGISPKKSLTLEFCENVPRELQNSYVRGYFDGDGSIYFDKAGKPYFALVGTLQFLKRVREIMVGELGLNYTKIRSKGKISELRYIGKNNVLKVRDWIYAGGKPWMQRKKDRFDSIG